MNILENRSQSNINLRDELEKARYERRRKQSKQPEGTKNQTSGMMKRLGD